MLRDILLVIILAAAIGSIMIGVKLSKTGLNRIKRFEALRLRAYKDSANKWTIGWGHLIRPSENWLINTPITKEYATDLLIKDLKKTENSINRLVTVRLTGNQYDALVSFVFNVGTGAFSRSTLLKKINANDPNAKDEFKRWVYAGGKISEGLIRRRKKEKDLFIA